MRRKLRLTEGERSFARNVFTFMGGRSFAVGITFLLTPVVARLFEPAHWGVAAVFLGLVITIGPLSCLAFERAIPVARQRDEAYLLLQLCILLTLAIGVGALVVIAVVTAGNWLPRTLEGLGAWLWLVPVCIVLEGAGTALEAWLLRHDKYKTLGGGEVTQAVTRTGVRIAGGWAAGSSVLTLVASILLAYTAKLQVLFLGASGAGQLSGPRIAVSSARGLVASYRDFPQYSFPVGFIFHLTRQLPLFVLSHFFGAAAAGFFAMADRLVRTPVYVFTNTVRKVFLRRAAQITHQGRSIKSALRRATLGLALLSFPPAVILWTLGEEILTVLLGARWTEAGRITEMMAPYLFVQSLGSPFSGVANVTRQQKLWFRLQTIAAASRLIVIPVVVMFHPTVDLVIQVYVWTSVISQSVTMIVMYSRVEPGPQRDAGNS